MRLAETGSAGDNALVPQITSGLDVRCGACRPLTKANECTLSGLASLWARCLLLFGNGVGANVTLRKSYAADAGWMVVTTGWALGVLCGVVVAQAFGSPGAHLNPAISLASAIISGDYSLIPIYWSAQLLGAMCGATLTVLHLAHTGRSPLIQPPSLVCSAPTRRCATRSSICSARRWVPVCWC